MTATPLLEARGLVLRFGGGEIVALLGPSGSGKSTMVKAIAGVVNPKERLDRLQQ